jgi:phage gpG-like protein
VTPEEAADAFEYNLQCLANPDLTEASKKSVQAYLEQAVSQFVNSESPDGHEWLPPQYRERPPNTLILTGRMFQEFLDAIYNAQVNSLGFDTGDLYAQLPHYAEIHDRGLQNERGVPMPKREFIGLSLETIKKFENFGIEDLESQLFDAWK